MANKFRSDLETMILASLQSGPLHGYGIVKQIRDCSNGVLSFGEGQLYPVLHRLEESGLIEGAWETTEGRPARKVYSLTDTGGTTLLQRKGQWSQFADGVSKVLAGGTAKEATHNA